jgi:hypothetical protein
VRRILALALAIPFLSAAATAAPVEPSAAACIDLFDPNESCSNALPMLVPDGYSGLVVQAESSGDRDWYRIELGRNQTLRAEVIFRSPPVAATLALFTTCGGSPLALDSGTGGTRAVQYQNLGAPDTVFLRLTTTDAACQMYDMAVTRTCPDFFDANEHCGIASPITAGIYPNLWLGSFLYDEDFYTVHLLPQQKLVVDIDFVNAQGNLNMGLFLGCTGNLLAASLGSGDHEHVEHLNTGDEQDYTILVDNQSNPSCTPYTMTVAIEGGLDLKATFTPPGWDHPTVPRGAADATPGSARVPATLPGNSTSTFLNQFVVNASPVSLPAWTAMFLIDDEPQGGLNAPPGNPPGDYMLQNFGPILVRGGRHTLVTHADYFRTIAEPDTTDDVDLRQYVWSPMPLARATPQIRPPAPAPGVGVLPNTDGFRYARDPAFAWVVSSAALSASDCFPLVVYDDYAGSEDGFSHAVASSDLCSDLTNFVVGHFDATPASLYPAVTAFHAPAAAGFAIDVIDANGRVGGPAAGFPSQSLPAHRLADVFEAYLTAGQSATFVLRRRSGASDLRFELFPAAAAGAYGRMDGVSSQAMTPDLDRLVFVAPVAGYYPVVVFRDQSAGEDVAATYDFAWSHLGAVDVAVAAVEPVLSFEGMRPNPMRGDGRFDFTLPRAADVSLDVYDAQGRHVRTVASGAYPGGRGHCVWDRRSGAGATAASGVYWARLTVGAEALWRRFVVLP